MICFPLLFQTVFGEKLVAKFLFESDFSDDHGAIPGLDILKQKKYMMKKQKKYL